MFAPCLKLRLDQDAETALAIHQPGCNGQNQLDGNKGYIHYRQIRHAGDLLMGKIAGVGTLQHRHTLVAAYFPVQLAITHINRINMPCAILQKHIRKTACSGADIHAYGIRHIHAKHAQRLVKLKRSAADKRMHMAAHNQFRVLAYLFRCLEYLDLFHIDLTGHNQRLRPFTAGRKPLTNHCQIHAEFISHSSVLLFDTLFGCTGRCFHHPAQSLSTDVYGHHAGCSGLPLPGV